MIGNMNHTTVKLELMMKRIILFVLLTISATATIAQTNPKPGYIITNSGDTIRGILDFRTNEKLSKQCEFWANGGKEGKMYKPGEIEASDSTITGNTLSRADSMCMAIRNYTLLSLWCKA